MTDTTQNTTELRAAMAARLTEIHSDFLVNAPAIVEEAIDALLRTDISLTTLEAYEWTTDVDFSKPDVTKAMWLRMVHAMKKEYHAPYTPTVGVTNFLTVNEKDKTLPALDRYYSRLAVMAKKEAQPLRDSADIYGWVDETAQRHLLERGDGCSIVEITNIVEDRWSEFTDTFASPEDGDFVGFQADAKCACGFWTGRIRWESNLNDFLYELIRKDYV